MTGRRITPADAMFAAAAAIAQQVVPRRARLADVTPQPPKPEPVNYGDDEDDPDGCRCQSTSNPPCSWCEAGGNAWETTS